MRGWPVALVATGAAGVGFAAEACSADSGGVECQCGPATVNVDIPADRAPAVTGVVLSGRGCATAVATCVEPAGSGCARYAFEGTGIGACDVDVQFAASAADFDEQVSFAQYACCPAYYVQPASAATIDVPDVPDAGAD
ncbi:MAG TPA: hypothetical protein VIF09_17425 [Polyangiaceae bacterium]|jgi:hypothetical protein